MDNYLFISDAAKAVKVESHVLRYWEEELHLPIKRNELGHRYYTEEDVERFKQIKGMKERGLQLKAIKMILKDGKLDMLVPKQKAGDGAEKGGTAGVRESAEKGRTAGAREGVEKGRTAGAREGVEKGGTAGVRESAGGERNSAQNIKQGIPQGMRQERGQGGNMPIDIVENQNGEVSAADNKEEKSRRLQWLLQQLIRETLQENNGELCREIRDSVVKELDYQFRMQEEREEERDRLLAERSEEHYRKMDELLRKKAKKKILRERMKEKVKENVKEKAEPEGEKETPEKAENKKKRFIF